MSRFNHDANSLTGAIGLSESRADEIKDFVLDAYNKSDKISATIESILDKGLNVIEVMWAGYILGRLKEVTDRKVNEGCDDPDCEIHGKGKGEDLSTVRVGSGGFIGPDGKQHELPPEVLQAILKVLQKFSGA